MRMLRMCKYEVITNIWRSVRLAQDQCRMDFGRNSAQVWQEIVDEGDWLDLAKRSSLRTDSSVGMGRSKYASNRKAAVAQVLQSCLLKL